MELPRGAPWAKPWARSRETRWGVQLESRWAPLWVAWALEKEPRRVVEWAALWV